jgi:hypothetical protein
METSEGCVGLWAGRTSDASGDEAFHGVVDYVRYDDFIPCARPQEEDRRSVKEPQHTHTHTEREREVRGVQNLCR